MTLNTQPDVDSLKNEALRCVGRNLLLFQQIEGLLKFILANHKGGGTPQDFKIRQLERAEAIGKTMLGHLVDQYGTEVLKDAGTEVPEDDSPADWITYSFRISVDAEFIETMRLELKLMTEQRNELVHGFLPRWEPDSEERLKEALVYLDTQRAKVLPTHEHLRTIVDHIQEGKKKLSDFLASEECRKQFELSWLEGSPLVSLLRDVATQVRRKDGWTYLAHAGKLARRELPEEVKHLKERYGFKTLKTLLVACETFDVFDEPLSGGGFRTLYRSRGAHQMEKQSHQIQ